MEEFKKLTDIQHILLRPTMYIGKINEEPSSLFIFGKYKQVTYIPALLKLVNELIDNSNDEHLRSGKKYATKINITMTNQSFKIEDNGRGIEVSLYKDENVYKPQIAWCEARAGSSFTEERIGAGSHGIGSFATNVFSKKFIGTTCDGKKKCVVTCKNNISTIETKVSSYKTSTGTSVYFEPDFERFGVKEFSDTDIEIIKSRIESLAIVYPSITYTFNEEKVLIKTITKFFDRFGEVYVKYKTKNNIDFAVFPSDNCDSYSQYSIIDGLEFINGGTHEQYLSREISTSLRESIKKKYKLDLSLQEIKKGLKLVIVGSNFPNMLFDSQTKERLTNPESEIKNYLGEISFEKIAKDILNVPEIIEPIIEAKLAKQIAAEKRAITLEQKKMNRKYVEKHVPAKSKKISETILTLCEGDCLEEHTKIKCIDENGFVIDKEIKDIVIGDIVFTHNHNLRSVTNYVKKIKKGIEIKVFEQTIIASKEHRFYVYDITDNEFKFLKICDIDKNIHKLVKSTFFDLSDGFIQLTSIEPIEEETYSYIFGFEDIDYYMKTSKNHMFIRFNTDSMSIEKVHAEDILVGDYICIAKKY